MRICHEAIYQALFIQGRGALRRELTACLRPRRTLRVPTARTRRRGLFLATHGFDVVATLNPARAPGLFAGRSPPHLVIADCRLQGAEAGSDAIGRLSTSFGLVLPGIILTGDTSPARIREASRSGFSLLHKPINPQEQLAAIRRTLAGGDSTAC